MNVSGVFRFRCLIYVFLYGLILFYPSTGEAQFYQGYQTTFGKNRVQYNEFLWTFYRFKNFDTYFYLGGKELAEYVGRTADQEIEDIEKLFDYRTNSRLQFMIFNRYSDYLQTNIGLEGDEVTGNTGGLSKVFGNKVLIYFDGNHEHLRHQIRAGVSQVLFQQLMYGGNIKDRLQSAVLLTIPDWYEKGLVAYMAKGWGTAEDNKLKDGIRSGKYNRFSRLMEMDPEFAGQSMWHYIIQTYGQTALANLLYMTRVNRSIDNGFSYVLGANLKRLASNWSTHYRKYYQSEDKGRVIPDGSLVLKRTKPGRIYHQLKVSPDGQRVAFVSNDIGKYRVYLTNLRTGKTKKILKGGYKSSQRKPDLSFPVMAWHPTGQFLTVLKEKKGKIYMEYYTPGKRKPQREQFFYFSKVLDFSYAPNGQEFVLSGIQNGQSDIFVYNVRSRTSENLTEDSFDDLSPSFSADGKEIYFSSNRINDTLGISPGFRDQTGTDLDIFVYNYQKRNPVLKRITQTPLANEIQAQPGDSGKIYFLSDANGIYNRHVAVIDSVISYIDTTEHYRYVVSTEPQTNYSRNIESHHVSQRLNKYGTITFTGGRYRLFTNPMPSNELSGTEGLNNTQWRQFTARKYIGDKRNLVQPKPVTVVKDTSAAPLESQEEKKEDNKGKIDINNYIFQSEFMKPKPKEEKPVSQPPAVTEPTAPIGSSVKEVPADSFMLPKQRNYDIAFATDYFVTQLDNSLQNTTYQAFTGSAFYFDPGLNILIKIGIADLMNDYKIAGGFRLSGDLNSNEYFLSYDNLKHRVDKSITFYRQAREYTSGFALLKVHTHEGKGQLRFPFNDLASLRGSMSLRTDRIVTLSTDIATLAEPTVNNYWGSVKFEYVYDNTLSKGLNLWNGLRYKIFVEAFRQIDRRETWLGVTGVDVRHYQKIHRSLIWASRFAASTSLGDQKLIYYLGSTDNAIVPTDIFDESIPIDFSQNYGFQAIGTNMRGFLQNIRNGNSFALVNNELRLPIFQYMLNRPIRSDFIRNFQVVGFFDVGTAWNGDSPWSKSNSFNTEIINGNPVTVILDRQVNPVVAGFGGGLRSRIFGYFIRADWAKGIEDGVIKDTIFYLSLGLDF